MASFIQAAHGFQNPLVILGQVVAQTLGHPDLLGLVGGSKYLWLFKTWQSGPLLISSLEYINIVDEIHKFAMIPVPDTLEKMYIGSIWQFCSYFSPEKFGSTCELPDKFMKEILKLGIVDFVMDWANTKSQRQVSSSKFLSF